MAAVLRRLAALKYSVIIQHEKFNPAILCWPNIGKAVAAGLHLEIRIILADTIPICGKTVEDATEIREKKRRMQETFLAFYSREDFMLVFPKTGPLLLGSP